MPTRVHESDAARHAAYRERRADKLDQLAAIGAQIRGTVPLDPVEGSGWYTAEIAVNRGEGQKTAILRYVLDEENLLRLQSELRAFKEGGKAWHGTYSYADSSDGNEIMAGVPGMLTLAFDGLEIIGTRKLKDYQPPHSYTISQSAVRLFLQQKAPARRRSQ